MRTTALIGLVLVAANAVAAQIAHAPPPITIDGRPSCATCHLVLEERVTLTPPDTAPALSVSRAVIVDATGRFIVPSGDGTRLLVFGRDGRFEQSFGRTGSGPGELRKVAGVVRGPTDSIYAADLQGKVHVYSPRLTWARDMPGVSGYDGIWPLDDGTVVEYTRDFHVVSPLETRIRTFGSTDRPPTAPASCRGCSDPHFAGAANGGLWLAYRNRYLLEEWSPSGTIGGVFEVASPWFTPWMTQTNFVDGSGPRRPSVDAVVAESPTELWVVGGRSPANWKPTPMPTAGSVRSVKTQFGVAVMSNSTSALSDWMFELDKSVETVIELIDLSARRVVLSQPVPGMVRLINPTTAYQYIEDADGNRAIKVFSVRRTQ